MAAPSPYDTRPMTGGAADLVDCARLAASRATLERVYAYDDLPRLQDRLVRRAGSVQARFAFAVGEAGRLRVAVSVAAEPALVCQRCLLPFSFPVQAHSELDLVTSQDDAQSPEREIAVMQDGMASLRELAEEELLLALPVAPACARPEVCGQAPAAVAPVGEAPAPEAVVRPFSALRELMKKPG